MQHYTSDGTAFSTKLEAILYEKLVLEPEKPTVEPYYQGYDGYWAGLHDGENPYCSYDQRSNWLEWMKGWSDAYLSYSKRVDEGD